ncbi:hypothetical protein [Catenulispora sp. EB89]|uniref:hypothetical protein n=1 Tax=Catenulispora sp. EB89 TaxID=3156257 RepID=UPI0035151206
MTVQDLAARLPEPEELRTTCRAFGVLDAAFSLKYPKYMFTAAWQPGVDLARMDNGGGDHWDIAFEPAGVFLYGFDHESEATPWRDEPRAHWPGLLDGLPPTLARWTEEKAFLFEEFFDATLCIWRETADSAWHCGPVEFDGDASSTDGSGWMFGSVLEGGVAGYIDHAKYYFEREIDAEAVRAVFAGEPLTAELVRVLNPDADFAAVAKVAAVAGYPVVPAV